MLHWGEWRGRSYLGGSYLPGPFLNKYVCMSIRVQPLAQFLRASKWCGRTDTTKGVAFCVASAFTFRLVRFPPPGRRRGGSHHFRKRQVTFVVAVIVGKECVRKFLR